MSPARPVLAAVLLAASVLLAAQTPAPVPVPDVPPASTLPPATPPPPRPAPSAALAGMAVAIDPGHGGDDPGVQAGDRTEAALTLLLAQRVAAGLTALGAHVVLIRDADVTLDADTRTARANQARAHVCISLHLNRSPRETASGAEVYTHRPAGSGGDSGAGQRARHEPVRWDRVQDRHVPASEELAGLLAASLATRIPVNPEPPQHAPLRVLAGLDMPAVLIELAYLSNPAEAARVATPEFHAAVTDAIAEALTRAREPRGTP